MENLLNILLDKPLETIPLLGLYAEAHFKFPIPFSRIFKKEPELIFDAPWRLNPEQTLTLFLVIKDAHLYPITLETVRIEIFQDGNNIGTQKWDLEQHIDLPQTDLEFVLDDCQMPQGKVEIVPHLNYSVGGRKRELIVDNYAQTKKYPLSVYIASEALPRIDGWMSGDTHLHTSLTNDQIEFGASLKQTRRAGELFGLDFITATDHSYDLDDEPGNYLKNDPALVKWKQSRADIQRLNQQNRLTIIPGEEISVANDRGATVHLLHFNDPTYFPGSGDSGEAWPKLKSELNINDVLSKRSDDTVSVGAHTAYKFPWLQRMLLKRGFWETNDHENPELDGVQILCGTPASPAFHDSRQLWIDALLRGRKLGVYGGSDGHGNFNRNWHVSMPTWSIGTHEDQVFGQARTLLRSETTVTLDLINAMKRRRSALSTGPMGELRVKSLDLTAGIGDVMHCDQGAKLEIQASGISSDEFGKSMDVSIYWGNLGKGQEALLYSEPDLLGDFKLTEKVSVTSDSYVRLEITSDGARWPGLYMSSPIWISLNP